MSTLSERDTDLTRRYGAYAGFPNSDPPMSVDYYGENPRREMERLLDQYAHAQARLLDLGCGAGFTICRLAPRVAEIWGIDTTPELLQAARERVARGGYQNVTLIDGDTTRAEDVARLPADHFDLVVSERGPNLNAMLMRTLRPGSMVLQELVSNFHGYPLQEILGRRHYAQYNYTDQQVVLSAYAELDLFPVSVKEYFYEEYFRDADHLAAYLQSTVGLLNNWRLSPRPYDADRDRPALELYARYNTTARGVRLLCQRKIFVLRRALVSYYPVDGMSGHDRG